MNIINGVKIANEILARNSKLVAQAKVKPALAIIMIGDNSASQTYVQKKKTAGESIGVRVEIFSYPTATTEEICELIQQLNNDVTVSGIILQLPAPGIDENKVCALIDTNVDVDGLNPTNLGKLWLNHENTIIPATVKAVIYTLQNIAANEKQEYSSFIEGKNVLIINRSAIIGKPLAALLTNANATVTLAHSHTKNMPELFAMADIIVSGTGKYDFIKEQNLKPGVILIDAGFNKNGKSIRGDVARDLDQNNIAWLTPVPGGIGPIGVACLIENVVEVNHQIFPPAPGIFTKIKRMFGVGL